MSTHRSPLISVVIPLYNKAPHVRRAMESVLGQSFHDFEVIVVNDASTDNGFQEVEKFGDPRIRLLHRSQPGPGGYAARNLGIDEARGEWIAFLDADDQWYPNHLEKMHEMARAFPAACIMGCGWEVRDGAQADTDPYFLQNRHKGNHSLDVKSYLSSCLENRRPLHTSAVIVRKGPEVLDLFPAGHKALRGGDLHAWLKMLCHHKAMAWSAHVGAVYFRDSVNMVTKSAPSSPHLMNRDVFFALASTLDLKEQMLLRRYFNRLLRDAWLGNLKRTEKNFSLWTRLFWRGDLCNASFLAAFSMAPAELIRFFLKLKNRVVAGGRR